MQRYPPHHPKPEPPSLVTITDACASLGIYGLDHIEESSWKTSVQEPVGRASTGVILEESVDGSPLSGEDDVAQEDESAEADVSTAEDGPFSGYSETSAFPDPRETSAANVRAVLHQIIEAENPLTRSSVYRLYVEGCPGLQRVGRVVRQALSQALGSMLRAGEIVQEDELGDGSSEGQVVRLVTDAKVRVRPAGRRDLLEIPPSELLAVLGRRFPISPGTEEDDDELLRGLLEHYGFRRLTRPRRDYLAKVLRLRQASAKEFGGRDGSLGDEAV